MIPFRLPFTGATHIELDGVLFTFLHRVYKHYAKGEFPLDDNLMRHTVVEATLPLTKKKSDNMIREMRKKSTTSDDITSEKFDHQLNVLNDYCQVLLVMHNLYNIEYLSLNKIVGIPEYMIYKEEEKPKLLGPFFIKNNEYLTKIHQKKFTAAELENSIQNYNTFKNHPLHMHIIYGRRGEKANREEDFNQAIIYFQTSMEIYVQHFIVECYRLMKWKPEHKIENLEKKKEFSKHVDHHFIRLFDDLNLKNADLLVDMVKRYKETSFQYRNNIVHEGMHYSRYEASHTKQLSADIFNLLLHDIRKAPSNAFTEYFTHLYNSAEVDIADLKKRHDVII
ncbi:hypothetical protein ABHD89_000163 [Salinicoccus halitifaciens]|uniref:Apea-like HEPN domain-containing protein n=2 Tax=Salinicoccus halitifaciens TaxID=1073415 RepID=A0ABV2E5R5_9STAP